MTGLDLALTAINNKGHPINKWIFFYWEGTYYIKDGHSKNKEISFDLERTVYICEIHSVIMRI